MKDLIVLVADKNMEFLIRGLLPRIPDIEKIREFSFDLFVHSHRDPGIYNESDDFLRSYNNNYQYSMVILDRSGCGREEKTREEIEADIERKLFRSGWPDRACAVAIDPELENWIWVNEPMIRGAISWENETGIYEWLHENKWKEEGSLKPAKPKEAFETVLRLCRVPRSSSIYLEIAARASYHQCKDPAFLKMMNALRNWLQ